MEERKKVFFTLREVQELVFGNNVSRSTMRNLAISGKIPTIKIFSKRFVPAWWVDKAIKTGLEEPAEGKGAAV